MSNYLAIATVTATLQRILQAAIQQDIPGARVTTAKPDAAGSGTPEVGVNIYMYQASPNPAWKNADLRTRRPKGDLSKQAQAGIDLYYLMTFHGNDIEYEPQRLLGSTIRTLLDQPVLTQEMIADTINGNDILSTSTLTEQVEKVTMTPTAMNTEELSKIWSVFFQSPYVLSFAYQGSTVLIHGDKPGKVGLPLRDRRFYITASQPAIEQVTSDARLNQPAVLNNIVTIRGKQLSSSNLKVKIGEAQVTPAQQEINDTQIKFNLSSLSTQELSTLRAGVQSLQVLHFNPDSTSSNILPFALAPTIINARISGIEYDNDYCAGEVTVQLDLTVGIEQRVFLLLNERISSNAHSYVFTAITRTRTTNSVIFPVRDIAAGDYLLRVQIDGAETLLEYDSDTDEYIRPAVEIR